MTLFPSLFSQTKDDTAASLKTEIDRVFNNFFTDWPTQFQTANMKGFFNPAVDMKETKEGLEIRADLPDMQKEDIHLEVHGDHLLLTGEKKFEHEDSKDDKYHMVERRYGSFRRAIPLPFRLDDNSQVNASYDKGVLSVLVPKPAQPVADSRRIDIR